MYQAGTIVEWLRDGLNLIGVPSETESLAQSIDNNEGVYLVPSFTGLGARHWLSTPGAAIFGLARTSNRAHFARAALESVCYQTLDVLTCMREDSGIALSYLRVDGGMAVNQWFLQFLSSLCGVVVQRPRNLETTALGAAMLAAIGCGAIESLESLQKNWVCDRELVAEGDASVMVDYYQGWQRVLQLVASSG